MTIPGNPWLYCIYMFSRFERIGNCGHTGRSLRYLSIFFHALPGSVYGTLPIMVAAQLNVSWFAIVSLFYVFPYDYFKVFFYLVRYHFRGCYYGIFQCMPASAFPLCRQINNSMFQGFLSRFQGLL